MLRAVSVEWSLSAPPDLCMIYLRYNDAYQYKTQNSKLDISQCYINTLNIHVGIHKPSHQYTPSSIFNRKRSKENYTFILADCHIHHRQSHASHRYGKAIDPCSYSKIVLPFPQASTPHTSAGPSIRGDMQVHRTLCFELSPVLQQSWSSGCIHSR